MSFTKLDSGIVNSTIWVQPADVLKVWIWFLSQADANGVVRTAAPPLAHACMVPLDRMREILALLESPDPDSRTCTDGGRRIEKIEGGWRIVNYAAYRERRAEELARERKREWDREHRPSGHARAKQSDAQSDQSAAVRSVRRSPTKAEAEAEEETSNTLVQRAAARFADFWSAYPLKRGRKPALGVWKSRKLDAIADQLIADVVTRKAQDEQWRKGFIPHASTYLRQNRWEDDLGGAATPVAPARQTPARAPETQLEAATEHARTLYRLGKVDMAERDRLIAEATERHRSRSGGAP